MELLSSLLTQGNGCFSSLAARHMTFWNIPVPEGKQRGIPPVTSTPPLRMYSCQGLEGRSALFACTVCMMMRSDCPRYSWLRYSLFIVLSAPFLAWAEKRKVAKGNCCCTHHSDFAPLRTRADETWLAAEEPNQPPRIIRFLGWKKICCPLTRPHADIERRAEPWVD